MKSMVSLLLQLIQEGQLTVNGKSAQVLLNHLEDKATGKVCED